MHLTLTYPAQSVGRFFRKECVRGYRFGFNGQMKDDEVYGEGNSYTAEYWQYDPRLGRRWNVDPVVKPWESSYAAFLNCPIIVADVKGDDGIVVIQDVYNKKGKRIGGIATIKQNFYYTTMEGEVGAFSKADAEFIEKSIVNEYKSVDGQKIWLKGADGKYQKYKLKIEVKLVDTKGPVDELKAVAESDKIEGDQVGNVLLSNFDLGEGMDEEDMYGGAIKGGYEASVLMNKINRDIGKLTDGKSGPHEGIHLLGGDHLDLGIMESSGRMDVESTDFGGNKSGGSYLHVRKMSYKNFEKIIQRALDGANKQLHLQTGKDIIE
jgi:hypothetical protein